MRVVLMVAWLFAALGGAIYHLGPGREQAKLDRLDVLLHSAKQSEANGEWANAVDQYNLALAEIPVEHKKESWRVVLEKAKAQMMAKKLPEARQTLAQVLTDIRSDPSPDQHLLAEVESALASSQYYMTWLMRLEGLPKEEWLPEIESSRQHYIQVAQLGNDLQDAEMIRRSHEDLEAAVRLARMDLNELQGLPLPSQ